GSRRRSSGRIAASISPMLSVMLRPLSSCLTSQPRGKVAEHGRGHDALHAGGAVNVRASLGCFLVVLAWFGAGCFAGQTVRHSQAAMDHDLMEVTIPQLEELYRAHEYTVTEVVQWYIARVTKYNGIYRAVQNLDTKGALATASREDAEAAAGGSSFVGGPM